MKDYKKFLIVLSFTFFLLPVFARVQISDYSLNKLNEFTSFQMQSIAKTRDDSAVQWIKNFENEVFSVLPDVAIDYEQESLIFESYIKTEMFSCSFNKTKDSLRDIRLDLKNQMKKNEDYVAKHEKSDGVSAWLYVLTGDVTSLYMTFSVAATMFHGMRVKTLYEKALKQDKMLWNANANLAQWYFYAPSICGGSKKKAEELFYNATNYANNDGAKYFSNIYYSQFCFAKKDKKSSTAYLQKAENFTKDDTYIYSVKKLNEKGISLFDYNRTRSGVDLNTDPNAKDL